MANIRKATKDDIKHIVELSKIEELRTATGSFISEDYFNDFFDEGGIVFVAEDDTGVIGYALGEPMKGKLAHLSLLAVHSDKRGQGTGKLLIDAFRKECDKRGLQFLLLYAPQFNEDTLGFYRKAGFSEGKAHVQFLEDRSGKGN